MKKKEVVMLFSMSFQPYQGRYLRVYNQARTLVRSGYDVTLLAWDRECRFPREEVIEGIKIRRFHIRAGVGQGPRANVLNVCKFNMAVLRYLLKESFDIVHCFNLDAIVSAVIAAKLRGRKAVLDLCEPEYYSFWDDKYSWVLRGISYIEKSLAERFDQVFVHNLYQVEKFQSYGIAHLAQVGSYPNRSMLACSGRSLRGDTVVIGRLGTIYENNGIEELVAAFKRLLERRTMGPPVKLFLAGRVYDSYREEFESLVRSLGDHVEVGGPFNSTELPRLYDKIDVSIMLYRKTPWFRHVTPTKLFESLVNGVPVIGSDIGDTAPILNEGQCGVVVDESDPEDVCNGIEKLIADQEVYRAMAENALRTARERYTWEAYQDVFLDKYRAMDGESTECYR